MGRLIRILFKVFFVVLVIIALTVVAICFDGLNDVTGKTDVALAMVDPAKPTAILNRAAKLYADSDVTAIILTSSGPVGWETLGTWQNFLEAKGVSAHAIIMVNNIDGTLPAAAHNVAKTMRAHEFKTVTLVGDYIQISRTKLALFHEDIGHVHKAHVGELTKEDSLPLAEEVYALYDYIARTWVLPGMSELKKEAGAAGGKAQEDAGKVHDAVQHSLDNLSK